MKGFSLFKFSRYFFVLFFIITVLPLVSLLLWSHYDLEQNLTSRHKQFLEMDANRISQLFQQQLTNEITEIQETAHSLGSKSLSLKEYKGAFNAKEAWWLDSPQANSFFRQHPGADKDLSASNQIVHGDYIPNNKPIQSYFVIKLNNDHHGLLLIKTLPTESLVPNGPYLVKVYAGQQQAPSSLIYKSDFRRQRPQFGPPHDFDPSHEPRSALEPPHGPDGPNWGPPEPFGPPPPAALSRGKDACNQPHPDKVLAVKVIHLNTSQGLPVATIELKAIAPPHPPGGGPFGRLDQWMGLFILSTGIVSSLLAGNYLRKNFIEPLTHLAVVATQVQQGDLAQRVNTRNIKQYDVCQTLEKFNAMLDSLAEKEQLRSSFISNLTHDFRTPLVAQKRSLELLAEELEQLQLRQPGNIAKGLLKNSEHLLSMVNHLLEIYQTEAGSFTLTLGDVSIPVLVAQSIEQLAPLSEDRQIQLTQSFSDDFPEIRADADYLKRVFINLLGNAIENIPKRSQIQISGKASGSGQVEIHVRDNGLGISPQDQQHLFDRYYAGTGDTRKLGSGLGLYICAVLIAAHGGTITVDSVEGQYTDFIISLPVSSQEEHHEPTH